MWRIAPHSRGDVIRLVFQSHTEGEYEGFIHMKTDIMDIVIPVEIAVQRGGLSPSVKELSFGTLLAPVGDHTHGLKSMPSLSGITLTRYSPYGLGSESATLSSSARLWLDEESGRIVDTIACSAGEMSWIPLSLDAQKLARQGSAWIESAKDEAAAIEKGFFGHRLQAEFLRERLKIENDLPSLFGSGEGVSGSIGAGCNGSGLSIDGVALGIDLDLGLGCPWKKSFLNGTMSMVPSRLLRMFQKRETADASQSILAVGSRATIASRDGQFTSKRPRTHGWSVDFQSTSSMTQEEAAERTHPWYRWSPFPNSLAPTCAFPSASKRFQLLSRGTHDLEIENAYLSPPTSRVLTWYEPVPLGQASDPMVGSPVMTVAATLNLDPFRSMDHGLEGEDMGKFALNPEPSGAQDSSGNEEEVRGAIVIRTSDENPVLSRLEVPYSARIVWGSALYEESLSQFSASMANENSHVFRSAREGTPRDWAFKNCAPLQPSVNTELQDLMAELALASGYSTVGNIEAPVLTMAMAYGSSTGNRAAARTEADNGATEALKSLPVEDWWQAGRLQYKPVTSSLALLQAARASEVVMARRTALDRADFSTPSRTSEVLKRMPAAESLHPVPVKPLLPEFWVKAAGCIGSLHAAEPKRSSCGSMPWAKWDALSPLVMSDEAFHVGEVRHIPIHSRIPTEVTVHGITSDDPRIRVLNPRDWENATLGPGSGSFGVDVALLSPFQPALPVARSTAARYLFSHTSKLLGTEAGENADTALTSVGASVWRRGWVSFDYSRLARAGDPKSEALWGRVEEKLADAALFTESFEKPSFHTQYRDSLMREVYRWRLIGQALRKEVEFGSSKSKFLDREELKQASLNSAGAILGFALSRLTWDAVTLLHKVITVLPSELDYFSEFLETQDGNVEPNLANPWQNLVSDEAFGGRFLGQLEEWEVAVADSVFCEDPGSCFYTPVGTTEATESPGSSLFTGWRHGSTSFKVHGFKVNLGIGPRNKLEELWNSAFHSKGDAPLEWYPRGHDDVPALPKAYRYWLANVWRGCSLTHVESLAREHVHATRQFLHPQHQNATDEFAFSGASWAWLLSRVGSASTKSSLADILEARMSEGRAAASARAAASETARIAQEADIGAAMAVERLACFANALLDGAGLSRGSWVREGAVMDVDTTSSRPKEEVAPLISTASTAILLNGSWIDESQGFVRRTASGETVIKVPRELLTAAKPPLLKCPRTPTSFKALLERSLVCSSCSALLPSVVDPMPLALLPWHAVAGTVGARGSLAWLGQWPGVGKSITRLGEADKPSTSDHQFSPTSAFSGCDMPPATTWWASSEVEGGKLFRSWMPRIGLSVGSKNDSFAEYVPVQGFLSSNASMHAMLRAVESSVDLSNSLSPGPLPFVARVRIHTNASQLVIPINVYSGGLSSPAVQPSLAYRSAAAVNRFAAWSNYRPDPRSPLLAAMLHSSLAIERKQLGTIRSPASQQVPRSATKHQDVGAFWGGRAQRGASVGATLTTLRSTTPKASFLSAYAATHSTVFSALWNEVIYAASKNPSMLEHGETWVGASQLPSLTPAGHHIPPLKMVENRNSTSSEAPGCAYAPATRSVYAGRGMLCDSSHSTNGSLAHLSKILQRTDFSPSANAPVPSVPAGECKIYKSQSKRRVSCTGPSISSDSRANTVVLHRGFHASAYGLPLLLKKADNFGLGFSNEAVLQRRYEAITNANHSGRILPEAEHEMIRHDMGLLFCASNAYNFEPALHLPPSYFTKKSVEVEVAEAVTPFGTMGALLGHFQPYSPPIIGHRTRPHHAAMLSPDQRSFHPFAHAQVPAEPPLVANFGLLLAGSPRQAPVAGNETSKTKPNVQIVVPKNEVGEPFSRTTVLPFCNRNGFSVRVLSLSVRCDLFDILDVEVTGWKGQTSPLLSQQGLESMHAALRHCRKLGECAGLSGESNMLQPKAMGAFNHTLPSDLDALQYAALCPDCGGTVAHMNSTDTQYWTRDGSGLPRHLPASYLSSRSPMDGSYRFGRLSPFQLEGHLVSPMLEDGRRPPTHALAGGDDSFGGNGVLGGGLDSRFSIPSQRVNLRRARYESPKAASNATAVFSISLPPGECFDLEITLNPTAAFRRLHAMHHGDATLEDTGLVTILEDGRVSVDPKATYSLEVPDAVSIVTDVATTHVAIEANVSLGGVFVRTPTARDVEAAFAAHGAAVATGEPPEALYARLLEGRSSLSANASAIPWRYGFPDNTIASQAEQAFASLGALMLANYSEVSDISMGSMYFGRTSLPSFGEVLSGILDVALPSYSAASLSELKEYLEPRSAAPLEAADRHPPVWLLGATHGTEVTTPLVIDNTSPFPLHPVGAFTSDSRFHVRFHSPPAQLVVPPHSSLAVGMIHFHPLRLPRHLVSGKGAVTRPRPDDLSWDVSTEVTAEDICAVMLWLDDVSAAQGGVPPVEWSSQVYDVEVLSECWDGYLAWLGDTVTAAVQLLFAEHPSITGLASVKVARPSLLHQTSSLLASGFSSKDSPKAQSLETFIQELSGAIDGTPLAALMPYSSFAQGLRRRLGYNYTLGDVAAEISRNNELVDTGFIGGFAPFALSALPGAVGLAPYAPAASRVRENWVNQGLYRFPQRAQPWDTIKSRVIVEIALDKQAVSAALDALVPTVTSGITARVMVAIRNPHDVPIEVQLSPAMPSTLNRLSTAGEEVKRAISNLVLLKAPSASEGLLEAQSSTSPLFVASRMNSPNEDEGLGLEKWFDRFYSFFSNLTRATWSSVEDYAKHLDEKPEVQGIVSPYRNCRWNLAPQAALAGDTPWQDSVFAGPWSACTCCSAGIDELIAEAMEATTPSSLESQDAGNLGGKANSIIGDSMDDDNASSGEGSEHPAHPTFLNNFVDGFFSGLRNDSLRGENMAVRVKKGSVNPLVIWRCAMGLEPATALVSGQPRKTPEGEQEGPLTCGELLGLSTQHGQGPVRPLHPEASDACRVCHNAMHKFSHVPPAKPHTAPTEQSQRFVNHKGGPIVALPPHGSTFLGPISFTSTDPGLQAVWLQVTNNVTGAELLPLAFHVADTSLGAEAAVSSSSSRTQLSTLQKQLKGQVDAVDGLWDLLLGPNTLFVVRPSATNPRYARERLLSYAAVRDVQGRIESPAQSSLHLTAAGLSVASTAASELLAGSTEPSLQGSVAVSSAAPSTCAVQLSRRRLGAAAPQYATLEPAKSPSPSAPDLRVRERRYSSLLPNGLLRNSVNWLLSATSNLALASLEGILSVFGHSSWDAANSAPLLRTVAFRNPVKLPIAIEGASLGYSGCHHNGLRVMALGVRRADGGFVTRRDGENHGTYGFLCDAGLLPRREGPQHSSRQPTNSSQPAPSYHRLVLDLLSSSRYGIGGSMADEFRRVLSQANAVQPTVVHDSSNGGAFHLEAGESLVFAVFAPGEWANVAPSSVDLVLRAGDSMYQATIPTKAVASCDDAIWHSSSSSAEASKAAVATSPGFLFHAVAAVLVFGLGLAALAILSVSSSYTTSLLQAMYDAAPDAATKEHLAPAASSPMAKAPLASEPASPSTPRTPLTLSSPPVQSEGQFVVPGRRSKSRGKGQTPAKEGQEAPLQLQLDAETLGRSRGPSPSHEPLPPSPDQDTSTSVTGFEEMVAKIEEELARIEPVAQEIRDTADTAALMEQSALSSADAAASAIVAGGVEEAGQSGAKGTSLGTSAAEEQRRRTAPLSPNVKKEAPSTQAQEEASKGSAGAHEGDPAASKAAAEAKPPVEAEIALEATLPDRRRATKPGKVDKEELPSRPSTAPAAADGASTSPTTQATHATGTATSKAARQEAKRGKTEVTGAGDESASQKGMDNKTSGKQTKENKADKKREDKERGAKEKEKEKEKDEEKEKEKEKKTKEGKEAKEKKKEKKERKDKKDKKDKRETKEKKEKKGKDRDSVATSGETEKESVAQGKKEKKNKKDKSDKTEKKDRKQKEKEQNTDENDKQATDKKAKEDETQKPQKTKNDKKQLPKGQAAAQEASEGPTQGEASRPQVSSSSGRGQEAPSATSFPSAGAATASSVAATAAASAPLPASSPLQPPGISRIGLTGAGHQDWLLQQERHAAASPFSYIDIGENIALLPLGLTDAGAVRFSVQRSDGGVQEGATIDLELAQALALIQARATLRGIPLINSSLDDIMRNLPLLPSAAAAAAAGIGGGLPPSFSGAGSGGVRYNSAAYSLPPYTSQQQPFYPQTVPEPQPHYLSSSSEGSSSYFGAPSTMAMGGGRSGRDPGLVPSYDLLPSGGYPPPTAASRAAVPSQPDVPYVDSSARPLASASYPSTRLNTAPPPPLRTPAAAAAAADEDDDDNIGDLLSLLGRGDIDLNLSPTAMVATAAGSGGGGGGGGGGGPLLRINEVGGGWTDPLAAADGFSAFLGSASHEAATTHTNSAADVDVSDLGLSLGLGMTFPSQPSPHHDNSTKDSNN